MLWVNRIPSTEQNNNAKFYTESFVLFFLYFADASGNDQYFIGASDLKNEGDWRWNMKDASSSFPFSAFNNNDSGYPGKESDCGCLKMSPRQVVDEYCGQKKMFLCEI